jgi:transposase InsO family protein
LETLRDNKRGGDVTLRTPKASSSDNRAKCGESSVKKGAMAMTPSRRYTSQEKLNQLGVLGATYYRWVRRREEDRLEDKIVVPQRRVPPPTPQEIDLVCGYALRYPKMGYKRLTFQMIDEDVAYLKPYQVYQILSHHNLLRHKEEQGEKGLNRLLQPDHPNEVWHIDLMYLYIRPRWYSLVDIIDGYSRFVVNWSLNLTMKAEMVTMVMQEALEELTDRREGEPQVVHDHGVQFLCREWRDFIKGAGVVDVKTRVAHPESNGRLERLHRRHREEGLTEEVVRSYYKALEGMERWSRYYNYKRPHSALNYLTPWDYYRGDPDGRMVEREKKLAEAVEAKRAYWEVHLDVKGQG